MGPRDQVSVILFEQARIVHSAALRWVGERRLACLGILSPCIVVRVKVREEENRALLVHLVVVVLFLFVLVLSSLADVCVSSRRAKAIDDKGRVGNAVAGGEAPAEAKARRGAGCHKSVGGLQATDRQTDRQTDR